MNARYFTFELCLVSIFGLISCQSDKVPPKDSPQIQSPSPILDGWAPPQIKLGPTDGPAPEGEKTSLETDHRFSVTDSVVIEDPTKQMKKASVSLICQSERGAEVDRLSELKSLASPSLLDLLPAPTLYELMHRAVVCQAWFQFQNTVGSTRKVGPYVLHIKQGLPVNLRLFRLDQSEEQDLRQIPLEAIHLVRVRRPEQLSNPVLAYLNCGEFSVTQEFPALDLVDFAALAAPAFAQHPKWKASHLDLYPQQSCLLVVRTPDGRTFTSPSLALNKNLPTLEIQFEPSPPTKIIPSLPHSLFRIQLRNPNNFPVDIELTASELPQVTVRSAIFHFDDSNSCYFDGVSGASTGPIELAFEGMPLYPTLRPSRLSLPPGAGRVLEGRTSLHLSHCVSGVQLASNYELSTHGFLVQIHNLEALRVQQFPISQGVDRARSDLESQVVFSTPRLSEPLYFPIQRHSRPACNILLDGVLRESQSQRPLSCR